MEADQNNKENVIHPPGSVTVFSSFGLHRSYQSLRLSLSKPLTNGDGKKVRVDESSSKKTETKIPALTNTTCFALRRMYYKSSKNKGKIIYQCSFTFNSRLRLTCWKRIINLQIFKQPVYPSWPFHHTHISS